MTPVQRELPNGYVVDLLPNTEYIVEEVWARRCYDAPIEPGDVVVDLGANQGIYTLYAAARGARVVAVEPDEANFRRLLENVERNGIGDRVTVYRAAVAEQDGTVDLFAPETDAYCDSGLPTTQEAIRRSYAALAPRRVRKAAVPALRLDTLLSRIGPPRIAVLKIDCEGAELAILRSAGRTGHARVQHLVMETHDAYPERDLFLAVQELGYAVTAYRKRGHAMAAAFATGHLTARRDAPAATIFDGVVAVLAAPRKARADQPASATAEPSFSAASPRAALEFRWTLDGELLGGGREVRFTPRTAGDHLLSLHVSDPATGRADLVEHHLWAMAPWDVPTPAHAVPLGSPSERLRTRFVPEGTWYAVRGEDVAGQLRSGLWKPDLVALEVRLLDPSRAREAGVTMRLEDRTVRVERPYTRIDLPHFPVGEGLLLHVAAREPIEGDLRWFPDQAGEERWLDGAAGRHELRERSRTYVCRLAGEVGFRIPPSVMPTDWTPQRVKIGLSVHPSDPLGGALEGEVRCDCERRPLEGGYVEVVRTDAPGFMSGLSFEVSVAAPRTYKLVWWWE